jgi:putative oxidoreductase
MSCGLGFAVGFVTPLTAAGFIGILTVATWTHKGKFFIFKDGWEYNVMLALLAILVAVTGPGRWSADHLFGLDEDLHGLLGLVIALVGFVAAIALLLVAWKPAAEEEPAAS